VGFRPTGHQAAVGRRAGAGGGVRRNARRRARRLAAGDEGRPPRAYSMTRIWWGRGGGLPAVVAAARGGRRCSGSGVQWSARRGSSWAHLKVRAAAHLRGELTGANGQGCGGLELASGWPWRPSGGGARCRAQGRGEGLEWGGLGGAGGSGDAHRAASGAREWPGGVESTGRWRRTEVGAIWGKWRI
jgi:hypothetical protein